jgi:hypothetical protein
LAIWPMTAAWSVGVVSLVSIALFLTLVYQV